MDEATFLPEAASHLPMVTRAQTGTAGLSLLEQFLEGVAVGAQRPLPAAPLTLEFPAERVLDSDLSFIEIAGTRRGGVAVPLVVVQAAVHHTLVGVFHRVLVTGVVQHTANKIISISDILNSAL